MEAKVDVRKLQILNDRINQTLDALNQVRVSVHGLGHTGYPTAMGPFGMQPIQGSFVQSPSPWTQGFYFGQGGLAHAAQPWGQAYGQPFPQTLFQQGGQNPWNVGLGDPRLFGQGVGLSHSAYENPIEQRWFEQRAADPQRLFQTFPCAFAVQSPLMSYGLF